MAHEAIAAQLQAAVTALETDCDWSVRSAAAKGLREFMGLAGVQPAAAAADCGEAGHPDKCGNASCARALRLFRGAAYPVSKDIDPRGHRWSEAYLDQALAALEQPPHAMRGHYEPFNKEAATTEDRIAWVLCQIIDDDAPMRWTRYRFAARCIANNPELMADLQSMRRRADR